MSMQGLTGSDLIYSVVENSLYFLRKISKQIKLISPGNPQRYESHHIIYLTQALLTLIGPGDFRLKIFKGIMPICCMMIMYIFAAKKTSWHKRAKPGPNRVNSCSPELFVWPISVHLYNFHNCFPLVMSY